MRGSRRLILPVSGPEYALSGFAVVEEFRTPFHMTVVAR
jgi:hypothetical protein